MSGEPRARDRIAEPLRCERCPATALLVIAGLCASCVADVGLNHPGEAARYRARVSEQYSHGPVR